MNAEDDVDDKVIECCSDADVFVYVANGTATFETSVSSSADRQHEHVRHAMNTCFFRHGDGFRVNTCHRFTIKINSTIVAFVVTLFCMYCRSIFYVYVPCALCLACM